MLLCMCCPSDRAIAEVREVSIAEVVKEFCAVVVANEGAYVKQIESCFPTASQDDDTRSSCLTVINSVANVMNAFFGLLDSSEVQSHYNEPYGWRPPASFVERWDCEVIAGGPICPGLGRVPAKYQYLVSQEAICVDALQAQDRIHDLLGNARRADRLLMVRSLRVAAQENGPVVSPEWSIDGEDWAN